LAENHASKNDASIVEKGDERKKKFYRRRHQFIDELYQEGSIVITIGVVLLVSRVKNFFYLSLTQRINMLERSSLASLFSLV
jgi:ABC-type glucose/galactose transport system permease subunit